jgi:beta-phosphoglucomutase-like phosphatase (HAD superfamily)
MAMRGDVTECGDQEAPSRALFFELEFLATSGRTFLCEAVQSVLKGLGVKLTPILFAQYFLKYPLAMALKRLGAELGVAAVISPAVEVDIMNRYVSSIKGDHHTNKGLIALTQDLRKHGIRLGALTCLDKDCVRGLLEQLKLGPDDVYVMAAEDHGKAFPTAQDWLKLAKEMDASTALCTVAGTSAAACKSALCAGMRCFAVPDALTAFQDFSGADYVIESLDMAAEKLVLKLVEAF